MAELPTYPPDAVICGLLADGPLPTSVIAERLAMSPRTVRHRLHVLRAAGLIVSEPYGHHLVGEAYQEVGTGLAAGDHEVLAALGLAGLATGDHEVPANPGNPAGGSGGAAGPGPALWVLAVAGLGLAVVAVLWHLAPAPPAPVRGYEPRSDLWRLGPW